MRAPPGQATSSHGSDYIWVPVHVVVSAVCGLHRRAMYVIMLHCLLRSMCWSGSPCDFTPWSSAAGRAP